MKRMISPSLSTTSLTTAFRRSSNSPWYFAPAISAPMSNEYIFLLLRFSGTSPSTIFWAMPSEIAVFPTPGSPTRIGLFLVLLLRIWRTLLISSSLPMTGSSLPWAALSLRLTANFSRYWTDDDPFLFSIIFSAFQVIPSFQFVCRTEPDTKKRPALSVGRYGVKLCSVPVLLTKCQFRSATLISY